MPSQRIKGQETEILFTRAGALEDSLTDTQDFTYTLKIDLVEKGYLGEKTNRHDEIFNGVKFNGTLHTHTQEWVPYEVAVVSRAQRVQPDVVFNISSVFNYPNGQTPTVLLPDVHFGPIDHGIRSRGDYMEIKLEGASDDYVPSTS